MAKITWADRTDIKTALGVTHEAAAAFYNEIKASVNALYDENFLSKTSASDQTVVSNVEVLQNLLANKLAADVAAQINTGDFGGGVAIGSGVGGIETAPLDGLLVEGNAGFGGVTNPAHPIELNGRTTGLNKALLGSAIVGEWGRSGFEDLAVFAHKDVNINNDFAFIQFPDSTTNFNAGLGAAVAFTLGSAGRVRLQGFEFRPEAAVDMNLGSLTSPWINIYTKTIIQNALSADPDAPANNSNVKWQSNGTESGDDGDYMMKITDSSGTTKLTTLVDFSAI